MSLATTLTRSSTGINAPLVTVEAHLANGLPSLNIVGLPEAAVKESKDRVRSAILNCQFEFPAKRIIEHSAYPPIINTKQRSSQVLILLAPPIC